MPVPDTTPDKHPRRERRKDARPGELMDAALSLFVERGFAGTRVEEVAQRAGVSKGTLFLYFPSKVELFKAVVRENIAGCFDEWNTTLEAFEGSTAELLHYTMQQWWVRIGDTQASGITKLVMSEGAQFPEIASFYRQEVIEPGNALIRRVLSRGMDRGEFRNINLDYAIYSLISPMIFIILWKHSMAPCCPMGGTGQLPMDPMAFIASQANILLNGLVVCPGRDSVDTPVPTQA